MFPGDPMTFSISRIATPLGRAWADNWRVLRHEPLGLLAIGLLAVIVSLALAAPWLYPGDPLDMVAMPLLAPGEEAPYWLGTDSMGRDVAAGVLHAARTSLVVGVCSALLGVGLGTVVGAVAGYAGGRSDWLLMRLVILFQATPTFLLAMVIVSIAQSPSLFSVILAIGLSAWAEVARLVRAQFRSLKSRDFVSSARCSGIGHSRIIVREILPSVLPSVIVCASMMAAMAILMESALSFLGVGDPNLVSWGSMIGNGREMLRSAWYLTIIPGLALVLTVLALNLLGDAVNRWLDPQRVGDRR